jgi:hypothetical protein
MNRIVPFDQYFKRVKFLDALSKYLLWGSTVIVIITIFSKDQNCIPTDWLNAINCLLVIAYFVLELITNYQFFNASREKRTDFIDNSLGSNLSGFRSENYFTNDSINAGIYKLAVNCFENSFFSYQISRKMIWKEWIINVIITAIFILGASLGNKDIVVLIIQLSLPFFLIQQAIKLTFFYSRTHDVFCYFKSLFNDLKHNKNVDSKFPEILRNVVEYESTKAWGSILLSDSLFTKWNPQLSEDWNRLKASYDIKNG